MYFIGVLVIDSDLISKRDYEENVLKVPEPIFEDSNKITTEKLDYSIKQ
jgi:hypothetical protein